MVFSAGFCPFLNILNLSLNQPRNSNFSTDLNLAGGQLGIIRFIAQADLAALLNHTVPASTSGCKMVKHMQRHFAGMETMVTNKRGILFIFLADLILESAMALQILVETLVGSNCLAHNVFSSFIFANRTYTGPVQACTPFR